jgi:hypothetical protein
MRAVETNAALKAFHAGGEGLVFNHFTSGPAGARDNVLHTAACPQVGKMLIRARPESRPSVRKVLFAATEEARSWLIANLGPEGHGWRSCTRCRPCGAAEHPPSPPPARLRAAAGTAGAGGPSSAAQRAGAGSWPTEAAFAMPAGPPLRLPAPPRLMSWNRVGDRDQARLAGYLDAAEALLRPSVEQLSGPLALRLDVGLPGSASLLSQRDLDNYLLPLARRLSRAGTGTLACVWGTKRHAADSLVRLEHAAPAATAPPPGTCYTVRTTASGQSAAFKEQIREQLSCASPIPPGPVRMQLCFTVGPARNWMNLWKPAIDATGQILGQAPAAGPWSPLDGRIIDLGLHCRVNPSIGNDVIIAITATHS